MVIHRAWVVSSDADCVLFYCCVNHCASRYCFLRPIGRVDEELLADITSLFVEIYMLALP